MHRQMDGQTDGQTDKPDRISYIIKMFRYQKTHAENKNKIMKLLINKN